MASIRPPDRSTEIVPPELLDTDHPMWRDPDACTAWCRRYGLAEDQLGRTWAERFARCRDRWAVINGITVGPGAHPDTTRISALGVPFVGALARAQARAEQRNG